VGHEHRYQLPADGAGGAGDEDLHDVSLLSFQYGDEAPSGGVTPVRPERRRRTRATMAGEPSIPVGEDPPMPERDGYIPGVPCWVDCQEPDPEAALPFYEGLFGWEFENVMPEGSGGVYQMARIRGGDVAAIGSVPDGAPPVAMWNTYIAVADADASAAKVREAGGTVFMDAFDVMDAGRMAVVADPEGAMFCLWQAKDNVGATIVNEHGALNFNGLATRDADAAEAFYSAVFGWKLLRLRAGPFWALSAYGDHLEQQTPGLRENMAQMGAPEGFIDVVAQVLPIAADDGDTQAHWNVTFAVDDVAATAAKVPELGGEVVDGPFDAPWTRIAIVKDPQGATFVAGQFVAENADLEAP
jgi:predicted enzyme related to lactoylglutathione lyase